MLQYPTESIWHEINVMVVWECFMARRLGDGVRGVIMRHEIDVMVVWECFYGVEIRLWCYRSLDMA
jgi:hypothetical protein